jgi:predicted  nucleic acid-binding Zn-ribbon protein
MAPKATAPSIGELEQERYSIQVKLFPLYAAQEAANIDATNATAAQASASGSALTEAVLAARKYRAEVEKFTDEIRPLKERAEDLRRKIEAAKHAEQVAKVQQHARAAEALAPQVTEALDALLDRLGAFIGQLNAMGNKDVRSEIRALARHVEVRLWDAGLPNYKSEGVQFHSNGTAPTDVAATAVALAENL